MTLWAAYQHFEEKTKGSIEVGKLADLAILSDKPLAIDPAKIADIKVLETMKKGESIYRRICIQTRTEMKTLARTISGVGLCAAALVPCVFSPAALAQNEGGLYIAESGFTFEQVANRGLAQNPGGQRFFVLVLPPHTEALTKTASKSTAALRGRVVAGGGVLLVCQRDIDKRAIDATKLVPGVVAVRGFPPPGSKALPPEERYFPGENPENLPKSNEALRRLRSTCS